MNLTDDHTAAFDEAYTLSGALVTIDAAANIKAITPLDLDTTAEYDGDGINQTVTETNITVKTADLPSLTLQSTVTVGTVVYRITGTANEGSLCKKLTLETP